MVFPVSKAYGQIVEASGAFQFLGGVMGPFMVQTCQQFTCQAARADGYWLVALRRVPCAARCTTNFTPSTSGKL